MDKREIKLELKDVKAEIIYHTYQNFDVKTLLVSFGKKRRVLSTREGFKEVSFVANNHCPRALSKITMENYEEFEEKFPALLGISRSDLALLSTGADMDNLAFCEKSFEEFKVCCLATAGVKNNALRTGVDLACYVERAGNYINLDGTINIILLTNATLSDGALANAIITATEAKTAALQDLDVRSAYTPEIQATGTGTDSVIVASGRGLGEALRLASGHTKMGELIGTSTKIAVAEALKKQNG
jgi:adenosylcobinamide hydrolase